MLVVLLLLPLSLAMDNGKFDHGGGSGGGGSPGAAAAAEGPAAAEAPALLRRSAMFLPLRALAKRSDKGCSSTRESD